MLFSQIPGQQKAKDGLIYLFQQNKLPHALLFLGKEGFGGLPLAIALAQYIACENKSATDACGSCASCKKIQKLAHPDVHLSFPITNVKASAKPISSNYMTEFRAFFEEMPFGSTLDWLQYLGAENKLANISADETREIIDQLNLKAYEDGYKIQIIWRPEYLGKEGNILLKLIEEPPANTLIFLVAEDEQRILNTILSRTQTVQLAPVSDDILKESLIQHLGIDEARALHVVRMAEGNYAQAMKLLQRDESEQFPILRNWFNHLFTNNGIELTKWVDELFSIGREGQKNFLTYALHIMAEVQRLTFNPSYILKLNTEEANFVRKLANRQLSLMIFEQIEKAIAHAVSSIDRNTNGKIVLMALSLKMQAAFLNKTLHTVGYH